MTVLVTVLLLLLPLLAALQYRWLGQLSEAERMQLRILLQGSAIRFGQEFNAQLSGLYSNFRVAPGTTREGVADLDLKAMHRKWISAAEFPHLLKDVWLVTPKGSELALGRFVQDTGEVRPTTWPPGMDPLRAQLEKRLRQEERGLRPGDPGRGLSLVTDEPPALIVPVFGAFGNRPQAGGGPIPPQVFILLELNLDTIRQEVLPLLTQRHFPGDAGMNYQVSIVRRGQPRSVIFRTGPEPARGAGTDVKLPDWENADATAGLFGLRPEPFSLPIGGLAQGDRMGQSIPPVRDGEFFNRGGPKAEPPPAGLGPAMFERGNELWEVLVQHRAGSLDVAVRAARNRNLAISSGILVLLGGSVVSIAIATRRAHRLAQQQIEFVAAVTHELRTPLAVIHSAGQNLADGVITAPEQTTRYGSLISNESRRLAGMIEQVLGFAGEHSRREPLDLIPARVVDVIEAALSATPLSVGEERFEVSRDFEADLPEIVANEPALRRALQNLLDNAVKYSGSSRWIGIRARKAPGRKGTEIVISVEDRGIGIPPDELPRIFEPFFRGKTVSSSSIHGNGLGLSLVKSIVAAHGGRISVARRPGQGTSISIHLPAARGRNNRAAAQNRKGDTD